MLQEVQCLENPPPTHIHAIIVCTPGCVTRYQWIVNFVQGRSGAFVPRNVSKTETQTTRNSGCCWKKQEDNQEMKADDQSFSPAKERGVWSCQAASTADQLRMSWGIVPIQPISATLAGTNMMLSIECWILDAEVLVSLMVRRRKRGHENGWTWYKEEALAGMQVPKLCIMRRQTIFNQFELGATCNTLFQNGLLWPSVFLESPFLKHSC